ncbi:MAG: response regulator transcription factor [Bacillota bacterium]
MYKVLIADDEPTMRIGLTSFISWQDLNCEIVCLAENGVEAIEYIQSNEVDIAVLDIRMPGINGLDLLKIITEKCPHICVIILTAYTNFTYAHTALRLNAIDYVVKLNYENELPQAIKKAIAHLAWKADVDEQVPLSPLKKAQDYIRQNYTRDISLTDVAEYVHLNPSYLCRAYRRETGRSIFKDINLLRIEKSQLLLKKNMRIHEVAAQVGFSDPSYFTRVFKKIVGVSPTEYQRK